MSAVTALRTGSAAALAVALSFLAGVSSAAIRDGVGTPSPSDPTPASGPATTPSPGEVLINFDDLVAPCAFGFATPLRTLYLSLGVNFLGGPGTDGGVILDACSNFQVTGYSGRNFLAFNGLVGTVIPHSYIAALPEEILFAPLVSSVTVLVGSWTSAGATAQIRAFDGNDLPVASASLVLTPALQSLSVVGPGIARVEVTGPLEMVLDDLRFTPGGIVPAVTRSWARLKRYYR